MAIYSLPLFPLNAVAFPQGLLPLNIFEDRYLTMVKNCQRNASNFGIVASNKYDFDSSGSRFPFASIGTSVKIVVTAKTPQGHQTIRCEGLVRFRILDAQEQADGLWIAQVENLPNDQHWAIPKDLNMPAVRLKNLIYSINQDITNQEIPILEPFQFEDCGWVANRWCELLDLSLAERQRLLEQPSPVLRLELIQDILLSDFQNTY